MTRKFSLLFLLAIFALALFGASAFAAKATVSNSNHASELVATASASLRDAKTDEPSADLGRGINNSVSTTLGYNMAVNITNSTLVSRYDLPSNQSASRNIQVGCQGRVHAVFTQITTIVPTRYTSYFNYQGAPATASSTQESIGTPGNGFPDLTVDGTGIPVATYHAAATGTYTAIDISCNAAALSESNPYPNGTVQTGPTEGPYIWPRITTDDDGSGNWFVHVIAHETPNDATGYQSLVYWRSQNNSHQPVSLSNAIFIDSITNLSSCVTADPASQEVSIVYLKPRVYGDTLYANDNVVYKRSTNLGASWGAPQNIWIPESQRDPLGANYWERPWETSAMYASDGCLHVLVHSTWSDTGLTGGYILIYPAKIYHWDDCATTLSTVTDASTYAGGFSCANNLGGVALRNVAKVTLTECTSNSNLYAIYTRFNDTTECSAGGFAVAEVVAKASSTWGASWGPDSNLTKTFSNNCAAGSCFSEYNLGSPERVVDTLRIVYMEDKDAGISVNTNGTTTNNPIKALNVGCFAMTQFRELSSSPTSFVYPFRTTPGGTRDTSFTLTNAGNVSVPYTWAINYVSGSGWLADGAFNGGAAHSGTVPFPANLEKIGLRATGPGAQGFYQANIVMTYESGTKSLTVPVDLYNFTNFFLPQDLDIRTSCARLNVNQTSETGSNVDGKRFSYFADLPSTAQGYLYDGFLVLGTSPTTLTYSTATDISGSGINFPTVSNPFGFLYAATASMTGDSLSSGIQRTASGKGYNRDSTLQFDVTWYASKIPDSCNFFVGQFRIYKGPKAGAVNNFTVAYYCDWDVPSDTGSNNYGGVDATKYMLYQRGGYPGGAGNHINRYAGLGGAREGGKIVGGFVVDNNVYIYPESGWENDSLWNRMNILAQDQYLAGPYPDVQPTPPATADDLSMVLVLAKGQTVATAADTVFAGVVLAGQPVSGGTLTGLKTAMDYAYKFMCNRNLVPGAQQCQTCKCGDADNSGAWSISDAVYLINYIFAGGPAPAQTCLGDADGSKAISISDAVYLINYIFAGGPAPTGC